MAGQSLAPPPAIRAGVGCCRVKSTPSAAVRKRSRCALPRRPGRARTAAVLRCPIRWRGRSARAGGAWRQAT
jgi:hypothetical protein